MAVTTIANQIRAGQIEVGLAIGVESMTAKCVFGFVRFLWWLALTLRRVLIFLS